MIYQKMMSYFLGKWNNSLAIWMLGLLSHWTKILRNNSRFYRLLATSPSNETVMMNTFHFVHFSRRSRSSPMSSGSIWNALTLDTLSRRYFSIVLLNHFGIRHAAFPSLTSCLSMPCLQESGLFLASPLIARNKLDRGSCSGQRMVFPGGCCWNTWKTNFSVIKRNRFDLI